MFYSFHHKNPSKPQLTLFQGICVFATAINRNDLTSSFTVIELFVYNKGHWFFCALTLYPKTWLSSSEYQLFLGRVFWFSYMEDHVLCRQGQLDFSFPICILLIDFSCLVALDKTYRIILNNSGKSGLPCLVLYLSGNTSNYSPFNMLALGFSYIALIVLMNDPLLFFDWYEISKFQIFHNTDLEVWGLFFFPPPPSIFLLPLFFSKSITRPY